MKKNKKNQLIQETLQQGHCCYADGFENALIQKQDLAISAQNISASIGITPREAEKMVSAYYFH